MRTIYHKRAVWYVPALSAALIFAWTAHAIEVSNVKIGDVTQTSATVSWKTDVKGDSTINYGLDSAVGIVRTPEFTDKDHSLTIANLEPATTYHFRVVSTDVEGNKSATAGFVFTTLGDLSKKLKTEISKITDPKELEELSKQVQSVAGDVVKPPAIVGPPKVIPETTRALITWATDKESTSEVSLVPLKDFREGSSDPYTINQSNGTETSTEHSVMVIGLEPSTEYAFRVTSEDSLGLRGETAQDTFTTKSILPHINNPQISRVQETAATVSWNTGSVLARGNIDYTDTRTKKTKSVGDPVYATSHSVQLTGLTFGTRYQIIIRATNKGGDEEISKTLSFTTVRDVIPPIISKVANQSTLYPSEDTKVQTIISWLTDEPAYCQVFFIQGLVRSETKESDSLAKEVNPVTLHTQVVVGFSPATVYKFWTVCHDEANNESQSEDFVLITPIKEKNIIDLILENFQGTFGWVNNIGK